jgi:small conductance mechanosensitive channel
MLRQPTLSAQAPPLPLPVPVPTAHAGGSARTYQIKRIGSYEVAPVIFQGVRLFDVAAPALQDPNAPPPVAARIDVIQDNFRQVVPSPSSFGDLFKPLRITYDPDSFLVRVVMSNGYFTLVAADQKDSPETALLTVTELDAKNAGVTQQELASNWADILQSVLGAALHQRAPGAFERQLTNAALALLIAIALTFLIIGIRIGLSKWRETLEKPLTADGSAPAADQAPTASAPWWQRTLRGTIKILDWLLAWSIMVLWTVAVLWVLTRFASTEGFARKLASQLVVVLVVWFIASLINRLGSFAIGRFTHMWLMRPFASREEAARRVVRTTTIRNSLEYAKATILYIVAGALTLSALGTSASAVVTLGAAVAFAISFGAQSLVKDFVNGFFILTEDQYAIGDFVTIGAEKGIVADLTLRITQLRADDGRLVTIPNSQVAVVANWTRDYSGVDYRMTVPVDSDMDRALQVFGDVLHDIARDPKWRAMVSTPPVVLGVESVSPAGVVLLGQIRTPPGKMFELSREINRRMLAALAQEGILGTPVSRSAQTGPTTHDVGARAKS